MFTGIVEELGSICRVSRGGVSVKLAIEAETIMEDIHPGDSIAVNGVCLTATGIDGHCFTADVMHETLKRSSLADAGIGWPVNLERAMPANGRFGGHIVSGHIDGVGKIIRIRKDDIAILYTISAGPSILRQIVEKGSIAVDGVSLTVTAVNGQDFCVSVIPHTVRQTNLREKRVGSLVNLENDMIGKYVEKLLRSSAENSGALGVTRTFLLENGFLS